MSCVKVSASVPDMSLAYLAPLSELLSFHIIESQQESHSLGSPGSYKKLLSTFQISTLTFFFLLLGS